MEEGGEGWRRDGGGWRGMRGNERGWRGDGEGMKGGRHGEAPTTDNSQSVVTHSTGSVTVPKGTSEGGWTSPSVSCSHSEPTQKLRA